MALVNVIEIILNSKRLDGRAEGRKCVIGGNRKSAKTKTKTVRRRRRRYGSSQSKVEGTGGKEKEVFYLFIIQNRIWQVNAIAKTVGKTLYDYRAALLKLYNISRISLFNCFPFSSILIRLILNWVKCWNFKSLMTD